MIVALNQPDGAASPFDHKPVLTQAHTVPLIYESHSHISGWRKGFEMTCTVLNESTSEGIKKTSSGVY